MKPPPNESIAKRADSFATIGLPRGQRRAFLATAVRFSTSRQGTVERGAEEPGDHVAQEERRISDVIGKARKERSGRRRSVSDQVVHTECQGPAIGATGLRENGLFQR